MGFFRFFAAGAGDRPGSLRRLPNPKKPTPEAAGFLPGGGPQPPQGSDS